MTVERTASLRYAGQNYEVDVPLGTGPLDGAAWERLVDDFAAHHEWRYGFALPGEVVELVHLHATAAAPRAEPRSTHIDGPPGGASPSSRRVWLDETGGGECPVHRRAQLASGARIAGPAIIEEADSTTLVGPGDRVAVAAAGTLVIELGRVA